MLRLRRALSPVLLVAALSLLAVHTVAAEQIRLSDGRFLQGDVEEVKEDGFTFRLTETGGRIFLRWSQVEDGLKKRLLNERDPDEGLNLEVLVDGARLELINGEVLEGEITPTSRGYTVVNLKFPKGKSISKEDVLEDGYVPDIRIDASAVMEEEKVLEVAESQRTLEEAREYYELARIADRLGLYEAARDYVVLAQAAGPDTALAQKLDDYGQRLEELIRQKEVLTAVAAARKLAAKHMYKTALDTMTQAKTDYDPQGEVLAKFDEVYAEIDADFTDYIIDRWYKTVKSVIRAKLKEDKEMTAREGFAWARSNLNDAIADALAKETFGEAADLRKRFDSRKDDDAEYQDIPLKKASFDEDGFYDLVGGHLPSAGKSKDSSSSSGSGSNGGNAPRKDRGRDGCALPPNFEELLRDADGDEFQAEDGGGIDEEDVQDLVRRLRRAAEEELGKKSNEPSGSSSKQDLSKLTVPDTVPSLEEWWEKASRSKKTDWLLAVYVKYGGAMTVFEEKYWDLKYR